MIKTFLYTTYTKYTKTTKVTNGDKSRLIHYFWRKSGCFDAERDRKIFKAPRFQNKAGGYTAGLPNFLAKVSLYFFLKFKTLKRNQLFLKLIFKTFNYYEDIKL